MITTKVLRGSLLGAAVFFPLAGWAAASDSSDFIKQAIQGNLAEISVGTLAEQKGSNDAVKSYGRTLVRDHTTANQAATDVAKDMGVALPTAVNDEQKAMHDKLANESGTAFDTDFINGMLMGHQKDVATYQTAAANDHDAAGQYATKTLPVIQEHLASLQKLAAGTLHTTDMPDTAMAPAAGVATAGQGMASNVKMAADTTTTMAAAPVAGANSFTEGEAKSRIEKAGFTSVSGLKKDDQGIWRGTASKSGQSGPVSLDFKGNVSSK